MTPVRPNPQRPVCETLEDRILHSADLAPLLAGPATDGMVLQQSVQIESANDAQARHANEIAFVDLSVPDAQTMLADLQAQHVAGRAIEIVTIGADQDGLALITDTLAARSDLTAVHVLAHGGDGMMQLGRSQLDASALLAQAAQVAAWAGALSPDADLLLYGCDFASTGAGQRLVRDLAALTGADVAASTDTTGALAQGGNWTLEYSTGPIEAGMALDAVGQRAWYGTLAVGLSSQSSGTSTSPASSFGFTHTVIAGSDRLLLVSLVLGNSASSATAVEFNGAAMSFVAAQNSPSGNVRVELWSLVAPALGTATVNITLNTASTMVVGATSYAGVDQTTPIGTPVKGSGNGSTVSVVVPASSGDLVVDSVGARQVASFTPGAGQTQNFVQTQGTGAGDLSLLSTRESGAAAVTMSDTLTSADTNWASIALQLRQVPASGLLANAPMATSGNLSGSGGGAGWADNWSGSGSKITLSSGSLVYAGGLLPASGGTAQLQVSGLLGDSTAAVRNLAGSVGAAGTTTWISYVIQPDPSGLSNRAGLEFGSPSATVGFAGFQGTQFLLGVAGGAQVAVPGISATAGQNTLLVLKIEHFAGNDTLTLYVNPTPGLAAPDTVLTVSRSFDLGTFTRIALTGSTSLLSGNNTKFDEVRVGQGYIDVVPTAAPVIISTGGGATADLSIAENKLDVTTVRALDYNSASLNFSISGGADAALFSIDSNSGLLRFRSSPDFETPLDAGGNNVYDVIVRVSDGAFSDTQAIAVTVVDVSSGPLMVTATSDVYDGDVSSTEALIANRGADGQISLREAITAANNTAGTDTIVFAVNGTFAISGLLGSGDDNNTKGDFDIRDSLVILGNGVDLGLGTANTVIRGLGSERVFDLRSGAGTVSMSDLRIEAGGGQDGGALRINASVTTALTNVIISNNSGDHGGAIYNDGNLTINRATISGNTAIGNDAGAIYNTGTLVLSQVELAGNSASGGHKGGAIYNKGIATLTDVWAHGNSAEEGGALWVSGSGNNFTLNRVTLNANIATVRGGAIHGENNAGFDGVNVTLSGNSAGSYGGAIDLDAINWSLANSTIAYNEAGIDGGAFYTQNAGSINLRSSILAVNTKGGGADSNSNLAQTSNGYNLATSATAWLVQPSDIITTAALLRLDPLAANGGTVPTHALQSGSAAIDAGDPGAVSTDARGIERLGIADIGAYESNAGNAAPTISPIADQSTDEDSTLGPLAFTVGDDAGTAGLTVTATSSNHALLPPGGIVLGGSGAGRTVMLTPTANANSAQDGGPVTVRISVSDGTNSTVRTFLLTVNPVADNPVAVDDLASTAAATPVAVSVLGNDYDFDGDSFVVNSAVPVTPSDGSVSFTGSAINFTPAATGPVLIQYTVRDSTGRVSNAATLTVNVGTNNPPTATGSTQSVPEDGSSTITLADLGYSDAPDNHAFAGMRIDSLPAAGSLWFNGEMLGASGSYISATDVAAGKLVFAPAPNANGNGYASFAFSVQDSQGAFAASPASLGFDVTAQPDPPTAVDDSASTPINVAVNVAVLANDSHPDNLTFSVTGAALDDPSLGTVSISTALDPRGSVLFTPSANTSGLVVIRYTVQDSALANAIGTLRVAVGGNAAPGSANVTVTMAEDGNYTVRPGDIAYNDPDAGQSFAALRIDALPASGSLFIDAVAARVGDTVTPTQLAGNLLVYQPLADGNGSNYDGFLFSVVDSTGARSTSYRLALDVTPVNDAPSGSGSATLDAVGEDPAPPAGATAGTLFGANFSDTTDAGTPGQNQFAGVAVVAQTVDPAQGRWQYSVDGGGSWQNFGVLSDNAALALRTADLLRFLPAANYNGTPNALTVRLLDNSASVTGGATINASAIGGTSAISTQTILLDTLVHAVNDPPGVSAPVTLSVVEDTPTALLGIVFSDLDAGAGTVTATFSVASGSLAASTTALVAVGGTGAALTLSGTIADINGFLAASGLLYTGAPNATASVTLGIAIDDGGNSGSDPGLSGSASSEAASASVTLLVSAVNDPPGVSAPVTLSVVEDTPTALLGIVFSDLDAGAGTVTATFSVASGSLAASTTALVAVGGTGAALTLSGTIADINGFLAASGLLYTGAPNATASVTLGIAIDDGGNSGSDPGLSGSASSEAASASVTLLVSAVNDPPGVSAPVTLSVVEDTPTALLGIVFSDLDAGAGTVTATFSVASGSLAASTTALVAVGGTGAALTLSGTIADINGFLAASGLLYTGAPNATASVTLGIAIDDGGNSGSDPGLSGSASSEAASASVTLLVSAVNDPPGVSAPVTLSVVEDTPTALLGIVFSDLDAGAGTVTATFSVASGSLAASTTALVAVGGTGAALTLSGTIADINGFLAASGLLYTGAPNATASVTLGIAIDDGGNSGSDPGLSGSASSEAASASVTLLVSAVNDPPGVSAPVTLSVVEDTPTALLGIVFSDLDAGAGTVTATFSVASGSLAASTTALVAVGGTGAALTLSGTIADINGFLAASGLLYTGAPNATASVTLGIAIDDGGNSGSDCGLVGIGTSTLNVAPLNKTPSATAPASLSVTEDVASTIVGIRFADSDAGAAAVTVRIGVDSGSLTTGLDEVVASAGSGSGQVTLVGTIAAINNFITAGKLVFITAPDATGNVTLLASIDDGGSTGVGGARQASATSLIKVTPVNDAPQLVSALGNHAAVSGERLLFQVPAGSFADPDAGDQMQYSATLADGAMLPGWLRFDGPTRTFTGTPGFADAGSFVVRVVARDNAGLTAQGQFLMQVAVVSVDVTDAGSTASQAIKPAPTEAKATPTTQTKADGDDAAASAAAAKPLASLVPAEGADSVLTRTPGVEIDTRVQIAEPRPPLLVETASATPVAQGDAVLAPALTTQFTELSSSTASQLFSNEDLLRKLEELRRQMEQPGNNQQIMTVSSIALTSGLSIGYVIWLLRGGVLVSSMLSALPAWQMIDPLPVLATSGRGTRKTVATDGDEPVVDRLFDGQDGATRTPTTDAKTQHKAPAP